MTLNSPPRTSLKVLLTNRSVARVITIVIAEEIFEDNEEVLFLRLLKVQHILHAQCNTEVAVEMLTLCDVPT